MDYFNDVLATFLGNECSSSMAVYAGSESSQISSKILFVFYLFLYIICVPKMNKGLTGLEWHEGDSLMTEFSFFTSSSAPWKGNYHIASDIASDGFSFYVPLK